MAEKKVEEHRSGEDRRQVERRDGKKRRERNIPVDVERRKKSADRRKEQDRRNNSDRRRQD